MPEQVAWKDLEGMKVFLPKEKRPASPMFFASNPVLPENC